MEYTVVYNNMEITYGELANVLKHYGFKNKSTKGQFVYINKDFDAIILLPLKKESTPVNKSNIASISYILSQKGVIAHEFDMAKWVEKKRSVKRQPSR